MKTLPLDSSMRRWRRAAVADAEGKHGRAPSQGWQPLLIGQLQLRNPAC